nr:sensor domain-containing diguanylate cyclase [Affinibrenneria salicis]
MLPLPLSWASLPDGEILFVNREFKKTFGYSNDRFSTVDQWIEHAYVRESDRVLTRSRWQHLWIPQLTGISEIDALELQVRCADERRLTVLHRGIILHDLGIGIATFEDISARKLAEETLSRIAFADPLTGLANRHALQARWQQEISTRNSLALLMIDMDGFKTVNDMMGHDVGDRVLKRVGEKLRDCVRSDDLVCRLGGDEFVVLLSNPGGARQAEGVCRRIEKTFRTPFIIEDQSFTLGASIGLSQYPQHGTELRELIKRADEALYRLKRTDKGGWEWFSPPLTT